MAESWEISADGTAITLNLRRGVMFQTGREFVAQDVARSLDRARHPDVHANLKPMAKSVKEVQIINDHTVKLVLDAPNPAVFDLLDMLYMIDDDHFDKHRKQPIGSGPYVLTEYKPNEHLILHPYKNYWRKPGPRIQEIEYRIIPDVQASLLNLESGTIHAISNFPVRDAKRLGQKGFTIDVATTGIFYNFLFNTKKGRFTNAKLRNAFIYAVNRDRFTRLVLAGMAKPMCLPWVSPGNIAYDASQEKICEFNLDKAKRLLAEAGYPNGLDVTIVTSSQWFFGMTKLAEILQSDLGKIGVNVTLEDTDTAEYVKRHNNLGFDIVMSLTGRAVRDPAAMLRMTSTWRPEGMTSGYDGAEYKRLVREAGSTFDKAERKRLFHQLNDLILSEAFTIPVATAPTLFAYNKKIKGVRYSLEGFLTLEHAYVQ